MSFGKQMRLRREELHLSRAALAEELGVSPSAISNYENGVSSPKEEVLLRLFDALEIDPNYLYRDSFRFSAMGVAVSPGRSVMAALAAVDAAVSSSTVSCFSASASMDA